ncbi:MxaK protein [Ramlibacter sp. AN1133]|uniref:MxaK protein n=1 Tax=Ramlibacter sp. AN1133 TaxID=3133429 RepID=UPI0030BE3CD5
MKRRTVHLAFAAASIALALPAAWQAMRLVQAVRINQAIARADAAAAGSGFAEARFAQALALSTAGRYEAALAAHKALLQGGHGPLRQAVLYNLGNLHLHEALKNGPEHVNDALPLVELAKQSFRDALRDDPSDWDARYNLERALGLAPEIDDRPGDEEPPPVERERAITTAPLMRTDLP